MSKKTTKKAKAETKWFDHAAKLPLGLFHTTMGPIIGRVDKAPSDMGQFRVRLWAPALVQLGFVPPDKAGVDATTLQQRVVFQPLALVETHIDLSAAAPFGRSPVPDSLVPSYEEYFAKFAHGEYALRRVVAKVEQAAPHVVDTPVAPAENGAAPVDAVVATDPIESDETNVS